MIKADSNTLGSDVPGAAGFPLLATCMHGRAWCNLSQEFASDYMCCHSSVLGRVLYPRENAQSKKGNILLTIRFGLNEIEGKEI